MYGKLCACMESEPRADMKCAVCGGRCLGTITPEQDRSLASVFASMVAGGDEPERPVVRGRGGRKRPQQRARAT